MAEEVACHVSLDRKTKREQCSHGRREELGDDGQPQRRSSGEIAKRSPTVKAMLWVTMPRLQRWRGGDGGELGGGELHGCGGLGESRLPEENQREHRDGEFKRITERSSGDPEVDHAGGNDKMTGDGRDDRRRNLSGRERRTKQRIGREYHCAQDDALGTMEKLTKM